MTESNVARKNTNTITNDTSSEDIRQFINNQDPTRQDYIKYTLLVTRGRTKGMLSSTIIVLFDHINSLLESFEEYDRTLRQDHKSRVYRRKEMLSIIVHSLVLTIKPSFWSTNKHNLCFIIKIMQQTGLTEANLTKQKVDKNILSSSEYNEWLKDQSEGETNNKGKLNSLFKLINSKEYKMNSKTSERHIQGLIHFLIF